MISRRQFVCGCVATATYSALRQSVYALDWRETPRLERPDINSDEGGLWALVEREEEKLKFSSALLKNADLHQYVSGIVCKLAGDHCRDLRVYLVRNPFFNASMAPNGMMQVWSGLLLRMSNEAQLAAVLAHEIGHYLARHSIEGLRDAKSKSAFAQFVGVALSAAGAGGVASIAQMGILASMFAHTRDQERQADMIGLELMHRAGYDATAAAKVWEQLLQEASKGGDVQRDFLFATHPASEERHQSLSDAALKLTNRVEGAVFAERYQKHLSPVRLQLLQDEIRKRTPDTSLVLFDRLLSEMPDDAQIWYAKGEVLRIRSSGSDLTDSVDCYRKAQKLSGVPDDCYRSLGLVYRQTGNAEAAQLSFREYLKRCPQSSDAAMIKSYMEDVR